MSKHTPGYKANFLWGFEDGSLESIGYELCNAKTEEYCRMQWGFLMEKTAAERDEVDRLKAQKKHLNTRCSDLWDYSKGLEAGRDRLREALQEITKREGPYSRDQLTHANNTIENMTEIAETALAEPESGEKDDDKD